MPINKTLLNNAVSIIDDQINDIKLELSYLEAAKKNLVTLIEMPAVSIPGNKQEDGKKNS